MSDAYLGNPNLKKVNTPVEFTKEQILEYQKCAGDPIYFMRNYIRIVSLDDGLVPFKMYPFQEHIVRTIHDNRFTICKLPRQSGKSTTTVSYLLHYALFNPNSNIAILANKSSTARDILSRVQLAYENLPKWMQQGVINWNKGNIELENKSVIVAAATSSSAIRGGSYNIIFLDEFAFVPANIAEMFFSSVYPTISSGETTKVFIVSTPLGMNLFYKMWIDAEEKRNSYIPIEVHYTQVPGRDDKWRQETIKNTSEQQFNQEFLCEFLGSTRTLIDPSKLRTMVFKKPIFSSNGIDVYEEPIKKATYCMIVDTAQGKGQDFSAFSVFDVSQIPYRQVAKYRDNKISPMLYPNIIYQVGMRYNTAFILLEINDMGSQVAETLHYDLEYENVMITSMKGRAGQQIGGGFSKNIQLGIRTSKQLKRIGCATLKEMIETDKLIVPDFETIAELTTFASKHNSYEAEEGTHDDLAMTLVIFAWLVQQRYFKDMTDLDLRQKMYEDFEEQFEQDMLPFGIIDDGLDDEYELMPDGAVWQKVDTFNK